MAVLAAVTGLLSFLVVGAALWWCRFGLDFTDEGFYLNWLAYPGRYGASVTEFGFVYHPLYVVLRGDVVLMRQANVLLTFVLAWAAVWTLLRGSAAVRGLPRWQQLAFTAGLATTGLLCFGYGLLTPSYNSLVFQGSLIAFCGAGLAADADRGRAMAAAALIGSGACLMFLAKPTGLIAVIGVIALVLLVRADSWRTKAGVLVAACLCAALELVIVALVYDGSVGAFADRIKDGTELLQILGGGASVQRPLRWDGFRPGVAQMVVTFIAAVAIFCFVRALRCSGGLSRRVWLGSGLLAAAAALPLVVGSSTFVDGNVYVGVVLLAAPAAVVAAWITECVGSAGTKVDVRAMGIAAALLATPHLLAFGSSDYYWQVAGRMAIFWLLVAIPFIAVARPALAIAAVSVLGLFAPLVSARLLLIPVESPYRQPSLSTADASLPVGPSGSSVRVNPDVAAFVTSTAREADDAGMEPDTPVLDLTGASPTLIWAWGAVPAANPWDLGGYRGSAAMVEAALQDLPCAEVAEMWVLTEPGGPREITAGVLGVSGATLTADYAVAAEWTVPTAVTRGGAPLRQLLYRPTRATDDARSACLRAQEQR